MTDDTVDTATSASASASASGPINSATSNSTCTTTTASTNPTATATTDGITISEAPPAQATTAATTAATIATTTSAGEPAYTPIKADVTWQDLDAAADIDQLGCLSRVLAPNGPWYTHQLLIPHEAIRFNMLLMERILQPKYFQPRRSWKTKRFFRWYRRYFLEPVVHHHEAEEEIFFPFVLRKPGVKMTQRVTDDHVTLMRQLNDIDGMERKFAGTMDNEQLEALAAQLRQQMHGVCNVMRDHLAEEEVLITPLLRDHFTEQECLDVTLKIIGKRGMDNFYLVPHEMVCQKRSSGLEFYNELITQMPGWMRSHYLKFSVTWYAVEQLAYINDIAIDSDVEPKIAKPKGCGLCRWY